jgi:MarR family transcriptional regulator, organic hydroperoxide resistance regulator
MARPARPKKTLESQVVLRHWLEAVPNDRLAHLVRDAARGLGRGLQLRLTEHAVSFGHWAFLRALWTRDGVTQRELSVQVGVMESTTFAALQALEKLGYVTRMRSPENRKNVYVFLTPEGRALQAKLVPLAERVNEVAIRGIAPEDVATTRRVLLAMVENLARDEAEADGDLRIPSTRELSRQIAAAVRRKPMAQRRRLHVRARPAQAPAE